MWRRVLAAGEAATHSGEDGAGGTDEGEDGGGVFRRVDTAALRTERSGEEDDSGQYQENPLLLHAKTLTPEKYLSKRRLSNSRGTEVEVDKYTAMVEALTCQTALRRSCGRVISGQGGGALGVAGKLGGTGFGEGGGAEEGAGVVQDDADGDVFEQGGESAFVEEGCGKGAGLHGF